MFTPAPDASGPSITTADANPPRPEDATPPGDLPLSQIIARAAAQQGQFRHDNTLEPLAPQPDTPTEVWATSGAGVRLARAAVYYTADGSVPQPTSASVPMTAADEHWDVHAGYTTRWRGLLPAQPAGAVVRYRVAGWRDHPAADPSGPAHLWARDGQGFHFHSTGPEAITTFAYTVEPPTAWPMPPWIYDATIYQIFLDRFHPGSADGEFAGETDPQALHGGTLAGVRRALPYLADLGVTCLWLSPLCAAETYHRYDATDLYAVDPTLGSADDLRALTSAAHALGMRVLLDFVPSHCSWRHPAFLAAQRDPQAPTASWFTFDHWPDRYRSFLNAVPSLPTFNTADPGARAHIIGSAVHWLRDCAVDGYRIDHAIGPSMDFWVALRTAMRVAPHSFTVGEATDTPDSLRRYRGRLDAILDFPLARALRQTFGVGSWTVGQLDNFLAAYARYMADGPGRVSFLDNHDMNRFLFVANQDTRRLKLAALCQFTLSTVPAIYYGTEVGMSQSGDIAARGDAEARQDMPWQSDAWDLDLLRFYRALVRLRATQPALRRGGWRTVYLDAAGGAYAYRRQLDGPEGAVTVLFNVGLAECVITLQGLAGATCLLATGAPPRADARQDGLSVALPALSGAVFGAPARK